MTDYEQSSNGFRFTGWHMAASIGAFFLVVIVVNFYMATLASKSWTGLIVKNSYVASQSFNDELAAAKTQNAHGWRSQITYENGSLHLELRGKDGELLNISNVQIEVGRPVFEQLDRKLTLTQVEIGKFMTEVDLGEGEWQLRVGGMVGNAPYRRDARVIVNSQGVGTVR